MKGQGQEIRCRASKRRVLHRVLGRWLGRGRDRKSRGPAGTVVPTWREGYTRAVRGWRLADAATGTLDAALCTLHSVIRTLHSVSAGRADRPGRPKREECWIEG